MAKVLPRLDDSEPVHGDIDTVTFLTDIHKVQRFICLHTFCNEAISLFALLVSFHHFSFFHF